MNFKTNNRHRLASVFNLRLIALNEIPDQVPDDFGLKNLVIARRIDLWLYSEQITKKQSPNTTSQIDRGDRHVVRYIHPISLMRLLAMT